jgi:hypothetical protein
VTTALPEDPALRGGVAVLGCGTIARSAHLPAYARHGIGVVGVWSRSPSSTAGLGLPVYGSAEELLADPRVRVVDIATPPRAAWTGSRRRWRPASTSWRRSR